MIRTKIAHYIYRLTCVLVAITIVCCFSNDASGMISCPGPLSIEDYISTATDIFLGQPEPINAEGIQQIKVLERFKGASAETIDYNFHIDNSNNAPARSQNVGFSINGPILFRMNRNANNGDFYIAGMCGDGMDYIHEDGKNARLDELRKEKNERESLENAAKATPADGQALYSLAKYQERFDKKEANQTYLQAVRAGNTSNEVLEGISRTLGMEDPAWAVVGLEAADTALAKDPKNTVAKRLHDQALIHVRHTADFTQVDLSEGTYQSLDLSDWRLPNLNIQNSVIGQLQANSADLSGANFTNVKLEESNFANSNLENASFQGADLGKAQLSHANFSHTTGLIFLKTMNIADANFAGADLKGAKLFIQEHGILFPRVPFYGSFLDVENDETLPKNTDNRAPLTFRNANLSDAEIQISGLKIDFSGADLTGAKFSYSDLRGADFTNSNLTRTSFFVTVYDCSTKWPNNFVPAAAKLIPFPGPKTCKKQIPLDYTGLYLGSQGNFLINFSNLDLHGVSFRNAHVYGYFVGTNLEKADLSYTDALNNENMRKTNLEGANLHDAQIALHAEDPMPNLKDADLSGAHIDIFNWSTDAIPPEFYMALSKAKTKGAIFTCRASRAPALDTDELIKNLEMVPDPSCPYAVRAASPVTAP